MGKPQLLSGVAGSVNSGHILLSREKLHPSLSHGGRGFWYGRAFFLAGLHENVYMDIIGLSPQNLLKYFPDLERNADKIVFGSDWPGIIDIKKNVAAIPDLPLSKSTSALFLFDL